MKNTERKEIRLKEWRKPKLNILPMSKTAGGTSPASVEAAFTLANSTAS